MIKTRGYDLFKYPIADIRVVRNLDIVVDYKSYKIEMSFGLILMEELLKELIGEKSLTAVLDLGQFF